MPAVPYLVRSVSFSENDGEIRTRAGNHFTEAPPGADSGRPSTGHGSPQGLCPRIRITRSGGVRKQRLEGGAPRQTAAVGRAAPGFGVRARASPARRLSYHIWYKVRFFAGAGPNLAGRRLITFGRARSLWTRQSDMIAKFATAEPEVEGPPPVSGDDGALAASLAFAARAPSGPATYQIWYEVNFLRPNPRKCPNCPAPAAIRNYLKSCSRWSRRNHSRMHPSLMKAR